MSFNRRQFFEIAVASSATLAAPTILARDTESTWARIKRTGRLRLGAINGASPYFVRDPSTGQWNGFCIDFGRSIARFLNVQLEWIETTWGNCVLDVQTNKIDAHLSMAPTPPRREAVDFTNTLFDSLFTLIAKETFDVKRWEQLNCPDVKIAVDVGSSHDQMATQLLPKAQILRFETSAAATMAVQSGRVDCQILVILLSAALLAKSPGSGHIIFPTPDRAAPTAIGIRKQSDQTFAHMLNTWLDEARRAGYIRETILSNMQKYADVSPTAFPSQLKF